LRTKSRPFPAFAPLIALSLLVGFGPINAQAALTPWNSANFWTSPNFNLGAADNANASDIMGGGQVGAIGYAAFSIGGSFSGTDTINGTSVNLSGNSSMGGDLGVAGNYTNAGTASQAYNAAYAAQSFASLTAPASIAGTLYYDYGLPYTPGGTISGGAHQLGSGNNTLAQGVYDAVNAATFAAGLASQTTGATFTGFTYSSGVSVNLGVGGMAGVSLTSNQTVLKLTNFVLNGGMFTLTGTAATKVVIDVSGTFSVYNSGQIKLAGSGMTWNNVLWNITGTGTNVAIGTSAGPGTVQGYLLASQRNVLMNGGRLTGEAIVGGPQLVLSNGSVISR
jgi:hypothetical protein